MAKDRFLIAPIKDGLRTDLKPWLLPESAFEKLSNAYLYEGRIRKRFGSTFTGSGWAGAGTQPLYSRLRIELTGGAAVGITDVNGDATGTVPGNIFKIGQLFSIGTEIYTVYQLGVPADMLTNSAGATVYTYNTTTGVYDFEDATPNTQIYFYPDESVMGFANFETNTTNNRPSLAFDTEFAYQFSGGSWLRIGPTAGSQFHGTDAQFFYTANWRGITNDVNILFVTNFNATVPANANDDPMWYYDGTGITGWTAFQPVFIVGANFVRSARLIIPFKDRLLLLNTIENNGGGGVGVNTHHPNRCRFSHNGSPLDASAYYEPNQVGAGGGGWIDAPTKEEIISAEFVKDRLVVYFERSTWELAYTANAIQPFVWQKINTELGSESPRSSVPFDKVVLTVGTTGIHACNGANVIRIDNEISDQVFEIRNDNSGPFRVAGVRDYFTEMVYWTFPTADSDNYAETYPNKVLVYNYKDGAWATNDDCITAFGLFEQETGVTWSSTTLTWERLNTTWTSGTLQPQFKQIIAGNQQGFVFKIQADVSSNAPVMQITNMVAGGGNSVSITIIDHNLNTDDFIKVTNVQGATGVNGSIYKVDATSANQVVIQEPLFGGVYEGGGTVARVSRIDILTKRYNPYSQTGRNTSIDSVDFAVQKTTFGELTVDYFSSSSDLSMIEYGNASGSMIGNNVLETYSYNLVPLEASQELLWHRVYFNTEGDSVQLRLYSSDAQMEDSAIVESDFQLEGFILNMSATGRIQ